MLRRSPPVDAVLTETERELGVAVADFGAGTIDLALYMDGSPFHTAVLPLGGNNVTNDIAIGLKTSLIAAEDLKIRFGTADPGAVEEDEQVEVAGIGEGDARPPPATSCRRSSRRACARSSRRSARRSSGPGSPACCPAGVVMTGGASQLAGTARLGREVLQAPVRVAGPTGRSRA